MACRYDPSPQEIEAERRKVDLAFEIACKALAILENLPKLNFKLEDRFTTEQLEWWAQHKRDDAERQIREEQCRQQKIKGLEKELKEKEKELQTLKKKNK